MNSKVAWGATSWDNEPKKTGGKKNRGKWEDENVKLQKGDNLLRMITDPFYREIHKWKEEGDPGFPDRYTCSAPHGRCPLCEKGNKAQPAYFVGVIEKKTGLAKDFDMSDDIYQKIRVHSSDEAWGNPQQYDVKILKDPTKPPKDHYTVSPRPKTPLTADEVKLKENFDVERLKKRCVAPTPEDLEKRIETVRKAKLARMGGGFQNGPAKENPPAPDFDESDLDFSPA